MENYYLLAIICCLLLFITVVLYLAGHGKKTMHLETPPPKVRNLKLREYCYDNLSFNLLLQKLKKVNVYNPDKRKVNAMDAWFKEATPQLMHDGDCLAYINSYGYLERTFWNNIAELGINPEQDKAFQQMIFSVNNHGLNNFCNLPFGYARRYKLLPEVETIIKTDPRLNAAKRVYELAYKPRKD
ncbi:MAG: hypothetical protein IJ689_00390 [Alphaproteobacteria bacterium]|nr:hypothetical protein [Alphaproteobacteria bacterium]